jgi:hypothetical protein
VPNRSQRRKTKIPIARKKLSDNATTFVAASPIVGRSAKPLSSTPATAPNVLIA